MDLLQVASLAEQSQFVASLIANNKRQCRSKWVRSGEEVACDAVVVEEADEED